jgi:hypothetical protein
MWLLFLIVLLAFGITGLVLSIFKDVFNWSQGNW